MRSKTSFFNKTLFAKNVTRFWPVWGAYLGVWILILPVGLLSGRGGLGRNCWAADYVLDAGGQAGMVVSAIFAVLMAMAVWSFLYNARACSGAACLPLRRETQFVSVALAGLLPLLAANLIATVLAGLVELYLGVFDPLPLLEGLAAAWLSLLFFYGFATLCAQLTGSIVVLPAVYAVLNFTAYVVELLVRAICSVFVFGLDDPTVSAVGQCLSPMVRMLERISTEYIYENGSIADVVLRGWGCLVIYGAVGIGMLCCALLLLRRRRMESAGDVVAVNVLKPIFRWCMALGCALCFACLLLFLFDFVYGLDNQWLGVGIVTVLLLAGAFVGWFAGEMLIRKSFRVFRRSWGGFGICCLVIAALMLAMELDLFGAERRVPNPERVSSVTLWAGDYAAELSDESSIAAVRSLHRNIVNNKIRYDALQNYMDTPYDDQSVVCDCTIDYHLKNGETVTREYRLDYIADLPETYGVVPVLEDVLNCSEALDGRNRTEFRFTAQNLTYAAVSTYLTPAECAAAAGLDSPEAYIFGQMGLTGAEIAAMSEETRTYAINKYVIENAREGYRFTQEYADYGAAEDFPAAPTDAAVDYADVYGTRESYAYDDVPAAPIDLSRVYLDYKWDVSLEEAAELYETCLLPDLAEGSLNRAQIIHDRAYDSTVCGCDIQLEARQELPFSVEENGVRRRETSTAYDNLYLTVSVDAVRTMAWLRSHGILLHTEAEMSAAD